MEKRIHTLTICVYDRDSAYQRVGETLHLYASGILLRTGFPMKDKGIAIIFLIVEMTTDELGALSGKLGQIRNVKVNTTSIKEPQEKK